MRSHLCSLVLVAGVAALGGPVASVAQPNATFEHFRNLPEARLALVQVKLTWGGVNLRPAPSLLLAGSGTAPNVEVFGPYGDPRVSHSNDVMATPIAVTVTAAQLDALLDSVATLPQVTDTVANPDPLYGFALYEPGEGSPRAFESILSREDVKLLLARMRGALTGNAEASARLAEYVCADYLGIGPMPTDRSAQVAMDAGKLRHDASTGVFTSQVRLRHTAGPAIEAPVYLLVPILSPNVRLVNASGRTCRIRKIGTPYIRLPVTGAMSKGSAVEIELRFASPDGYPVRFRGEVFAGPGDP